MGIEPVVADGVIVAEGVGGVLDGTTVIVDVGVATFTALGVGVVNDV